MKYDSYVINDGVNDVTIYPLIYIDENEKRYIIYRKEDLKDIFVGIISNDKIMPVSDDEIDRLEKVYKDIFDKIKRNEVD